MRAFEATGDIVVPQVVVLPINFTNRQPQGVTGNSFRWDLPLAVRRTTLGAAVKDLQGIAGVKH